VSSRPEPDDDVVRVHELDEETQASIVDAMQKSTPVHEFLDIRIVEIGPDYAVLSMPVRPQALNRNGTIHGGVLATLMDVSAGVSASRHVQANRPDAVLVTSDLHIRYLKRHRGDMLLSRAHNVQVGNTVVVVECQILDEDRVVAVGDLSMMVIDRRD
jgi:uncharacterized protein (TIGR00369 family)